MGSQLLDWEGNGENMISEGSPVYDVWSNPWAMVDQNDRDVAEYKADMVNNPPHYNKAGIEVIDVIEAYVKDPISYCMGNVVKYTCRAGHKGHELEDWKKALWYLERAIELREKDEDTVPDVPREQGDQP